MSGSLLVVPGELSKASVLSNKKRKLLKPIEGIDQDKLTPKKQLQDWIKTYNKKGALDAFLDQSMSPSSRNSKRMAVNQSVDQCYFNPGVGQIVLNSSGLGGGYFIMCQLGRKVARVFTLSSIPHFPLRRHRRWMLRKLRL